MFSRIEITTTQHHAGGDGFGVAVRITQPREVEPRALARVAANPAVMVGDSVFKIRDDHIVLSPGEDGDVLSKKVLRAVGVRGRREEVDRRGFGINGQMIPTLVDRV